MTHSSFCFSSTASHSSCHHTIYVGFPDPGRWNETDLPFISHVSRVWPQQGESDVFLVRGLSVSSAWLAWQHTPGLWLAETRSRDQNPGFLLDHEDRHRSPHARRGRWKLQQLTYSQCDFCPVTFKWHGPGLMWWNTHTSEAVFENIIKQLSNWCPSCFLHPVWHTF